MCLSKKKDLKWLEINDWFYIDCLVHSILETLKGWILFYLDSLIGNTKNITLELL